ncbi:MAG: tetratricopeptide repeat protein [Candidatus Kapaibacterium sp.]
MKKSLYILIYGLIIILIQSCASSDKSDRSSSEIIKESLSKMQDIDTSWFDLRAREHVIRGSKLEQQERYAEALIQFQQALRYDSSFAIHYAMAKCYKEIEEFDLALEHLARVLDKEPEFLPALNLTGEIFIIQYKIEKAIEIFAKIYEIEPKERNLLNLARLYEFTDKQKSIELYKQLIDQSEKSIYYERLSRLYEQTGQHEKYLDALENLFHANPGDTHTAVRLVMEYAQKDNFDKSWEIISEAGQYLPSSEMVVCYGAMAESLLGDTTQSGKNNVRKFLSKIDDKFYSNWRIHALSGYLANQIDSVEAAGKFFNHAIQVADTNADIPIQIALNYYDHKHFPIGIELLQKEEKHYEDDWRYPFFISYGYLLMDSARGALPPIRRAVGVDSSNVEAWSQMGTIYDELGMHDSSDHAFGHALKLDPENSLLLNNYAYSLAEREVMLDSAYSMSGRAVELDPDNAAYLDTHGWVLFKRGNPEEALEYIQKSIETGNASAEVFEHLGDIYIEMDRPEKATEAWRTSLEMEPGRESVEKKLERYK